MRKIVSSVKVLDKFPRAVPKLSRPPSDNSKLLKFVKNKLKI